MRRTLVAVAIALGFAAPTIELVLRICTNLFFDPLPTLLHVVAFYLIPISLSVTLYLISQPYTPARGRVASICVSYALILSIAYSIWFLPISWISVLGIIGLGIGIMGLVPYFLFAAAISILHDWSRWLPEEISRSRRTRVLRTLPLLIPVLLILWWNPIMIKIGDSLLESDNVTTRYTGLAVLDHFTSAEELRWRSFEIHTNFFGTELYDSGRLRDAYYYIYGTRPGIAKKSESLFGPAEWEFDMDRGSTVIGKRQQGLELGESALDARVKTADGYGYYEWTMVFDNRTADRKEARAAIQLPLYSVVSKASLWVDGEEREAAYGTTAHVRSVYKQIVQRRRDPLLVTMIGPDQVQLQCFPVPAQSSMKVRLGITCPLVDGKLQVPRFIETNFDIPDNLQHSIWVEGDATGRAVVAGTDEQDAGHQLTLSNDMLSRLDTFFQFDTDTPQQYVFDNGALTLTRLGEKSITNPPVLVVDGRDDVFDRFGDLQWSSMPFSAVIVAHPFGYSVWDGKQDLGEFMADQSTHGGVNPCPALVRAISDARSKKAPIVWLHGSLPSAVRDDLALEQTLRRGDDHIVVTCVAVSGEINSLVSDLTYMRWFKPIAPTGNFADDVHAAVAIASEQYAVADGQIPLGGQPSSGFAFTQADTVGMSHPYRLFLYSEIMNDWYAHGKVPADLKHQALVSRLVTPVSGAVVLESQSQYRAADLDPSVGAENIPKIPEPEFYLLLSLALAVTAFAYWRKRRAECGALR